MHPWRRTRSPDTRLHARPGRPRRPVGSRLRCLHCGSRRPRIAFVAPAGTATRQGKRLIALAWMEGCGGRRGRGDIAEAFRCSPGIRMALADSRRPAAFPATSRTRSPGLTPLLLRVAIQSRPGPTPTDELNGSRFNRGGSDWIWYQRTSVPLAQATEKQTAFWLTVELLKFDRDQDTVGGCHWIGETGALEDRRTEIHCPTGVWGYRPNQAIGAGQLDERPPPPNACVSV